MDQVQEILKIIFGDSVSVSSVLQIVITILLPIISIAYSRIRNKLISAETQLSIKSEQVKSVLASLKSTNDCMSLMANMICNIYLKSNTITDADKKELVQFANEIDKIAGIELTQSTKEIIEVVGKYVPNINDKKEEILEQTAKAEEIIDTVNDATKAAIDKLTV